MKRKRLFTGAITLLSAVFFVVGCSQETKTLESPSEIKEQVQEIDNNEDNIENSLEAEEPSGSEIELSEETDDIKDSLLLNYTLFSDDNISVTLEKITNEGAFFLVENKLDQALYYTNSVLSFDGVNLSDGAGLIYDSTLLAPKCEGQVFTELEYTQTSVPDYIYGHALYGTEDWSIDEEIDFSYGDIESLSNDPILSSDYTVYEDDYIKVYFNSIEDGNAIFYVHNFSENLLSYVNASIAIDGINYSDEAGLIYNSTYIAPHSTAVVLTELTEEVDSNVRVISGSGGYYIEKMEIDKDFSYSEISIN